MSREGFEPPTFLCGGVTARCHHHSATCPCALGDSDPDHSRFRRDASACWAKGAWYPRCDSNAHCLRLERSASYRLGYEGIVPPGGIEPPSLPGRSRLPVPFGHGGEAGSPGFEPGSARLRTSEVACYPRSHREAEAERIELPRALPDPSRFSGPISTPALRTSRRRARDSNSDGREPLPVFGTGAVTIWLTRLSGGTGTRTQTGNALTSLAARPLAVRIPTREPLPRFERRPPTYRVGALPLRSERHRAGCRNRTCAYRATRAVPSHLANPALPRQVSNLHSCG